MNLRRWFQEHSLRLLAIRDAPEAIAGGIAIGIFFGFTPLFGLKTLSAIFFAWLTRSNIIATVLAGTLHDLIFPFMPVIYWTEYGVGYWLLNQEWPQHLPTLHLKWHEFRSWTTLLTVGRPWLLGSIACGAPVSLVCYFVAKFIIVRHRRKHPHGTTEKSL